MRRILPWILALIFLLGGCAGAETPNPESSGAETEASSGAAEDLPPEVTGPDANGIFPSISTEDFERWVTIGEPDAEKPGDGTITPFLETESCQRYLDQQFNGISDWKVLYEDDHYVFQQGMYDPYTYSWRDQWTAYRFVMLGTEQSNVFDRAAFICIDQYVVNASDGDFYLPQINSLIYHCHGWESSLRFGGEEEYAGARSVYRVENDFYPSLVNSETERTLLLDFWMRNEILPVREIPEGLGHILFTADTLEGYEMNGNPKDRIVYLYRDNDSIGMMDAAYFDAASEELHPLTLGSGLYSPQLIVLNPGCFALVNADSDTLSLYHPDAETPWEPAAVLSGRGKGLSSGSVYLPLQPKTDKKDSGLHVLPYFNQEEQLLYFCTFRDDGTVVENLSTDLRASRDGWFLDFQNFSDGIAYFLYYPDGGSYRGTHLAMNLGSGKSHALQIWKDESPFTCTAEGGLNIRSGPGADYEKLGIIPEQAKAIVLQEIGGWCYVVYGDIVGWASAEYLTQRPEQEQSLASVG